MFSLTGNTSVISHDLSLPIDVSSGEWEIGLIELNTYNSIPNIEQNVNDKFYYSQNGEITIPEGSYEIEDIEKYIKSKLPTNVTLSLKANNNTLKCEILCSESVDFTKEHSLGKMLGFKAEVLQANTLHTSNQPVDIMRVNTIRVECNVVRGSYQNGVEGHVVHEFYPSVPPGYKIVEIPKNVIYLPVNIKRVNNLTVSLKDQNGDLINFRGEHITVRLHIRYGTNI